MKTFAETMKLFLQAAPTNIDVAALTTTLREIAGVRGVHDLHVWSLDGENHVMTVHIVVESSSDFQRTSAVKTLVRAKIAALGKVHATIEMETDQDDCPDVACVKG